jgi:hypothetical protein
LNSPVFKWPDVKTVDKAVRHWTQVIVQGRDDVRRIGYFGSYARGDWGVGSDLDLVLILDRSESSFERRPLSWNTLELPVPTDLLVYTQGEWEDLAESKSGFFRTMNDEVIWVYGG